MINNCNSTNNYSSRHRRSYQKQPVYTSDKRAKFTQRENKKWIRFLTVLGYIFFVSLPALSLSVYYIYVWDPHYVTKIDNIDYPAKYFDTIKSDTDRMPRSEFNQEEEHLDKFAGLPQQNPNLSEILRERNKDDLSTSPSTSTKPT